MRIVCIKWGTKYGPEYVHKLKAMCERHIPHTGFMCMTDVPVLGVMCVPLNTSLPTWWSKIGLFRKGYFYEDILYLDLDVVITGPIDPFFKAFASDRTKLWALDDFSYSLRTPKKGISHETQKLLGGAGTINSSVMLWDGTQKFQHTIFDTFDTDVMDELHGDQNWITRALWPDHIGLLPDGIATSYKYNHGQISPISVFHGDPKPADVRTGWVVENWC